MRLNNMYVLCALSLENYLLSIWYFSILHHLKMYINFDQSLIINIVIEKKMEARKNISSHDLTEQCCWREKKVYSQRQPDEVPLRLQNVWFIHYALTTMIIVINLIVSNVSTVTRDAAQMREFKKKVVKTFSVNMNLKGKRFHKSWSCLWIATTINCT